MAGGTKHTQNFAYELFMSQSIHEKLGSLQLNKKYFWNTLLLNAVKSCYKAVLCDILVYKGQRKMWKIYL